MKFTEVVSQEDQTILTRFIETYASAFNQRPTLKTSLNYLMRYWEENKNQYLYKLLGNNLILSKDIKWGDSRQEKKKAIYRNLFSNSNHKDFYKAWADFIINLDVEVNSEYWALSNLLRDYDALLDNQVGFSMTIPLPEGKTYKIEERTKTAKCIRKIGEAYNMFGYEDFLLDHSRVLNRPELDVKLCLSIHPMDYLTMSENDCNWQSCMKWSNTGDYRMGTVEMMNSDCVVCAYVYNETYPLMEEFGYDDEWNSKRWRELFIIKKDAIVSVRPYPYEYTEIEKQIILWLRELAQENLGWRYDERIIIGEGIDGDELSFYDHRERHWIFEPETNMMYSDFYYKHQMVLAEGFEDHPRDYNYIPLPYSGPAICMICGEDAYWDRDDAWLVTCEKCDRGAKCACCDDYYPKESMYEIDGYMYCEDCYENYTVIDYYTRERHIRDDYTSVSLYRKIEIDGKEIYKYLDMSQSQCINLLNDGFAKFQSEQPTFETFTFHLNPDFFSRKVYAIDLDKLEEGFIHKHFRDHRHNLKDYYCWRVVYPLSPKEEVSFTENDLRF